MSTYLIIFLFILFFAILFGLIWIIPSKGEFGEKMVAKILSQLPKEEYVVINNLLIKQNGKTTQIDHVVVSQYRIFVIETKNYKGWISGNTDSEFWMQNIYGYKYQLYNPIRQNQGHIRMLNRLLPSIDPNLFVSVIAFSGKATLNVNTDEQVVYWDQINEVIRSFYRKWLSAEDAQMAYNTLLAANNDSKEDRQQHVRNVRGQIVKNQTAVANGRCPRCGGQLVLRDGRYGKFYGCSNYPRCRYTHEW